ncbi:MAG: hypothetical protein ACREMA_09130 [Longimicrobiales bacterium]
MRAAFHSGIVLAVSVAGLNSCQSHKVPPVAQPPVALGADLVAIPRFTPPVNPCTASIAMPSRPSSAAGAIPMPNAGRSDWLSTSGPVAMPNACAPRDSSAAGVLKRWWFE